MASPDLRQYVDLTVYDVSPVDLLNRALSDIAVKYPGWTAQAGDPGLVVLEAASLIVAELVFAINRLPGATVEVLLRLFGVTKSQGAQATATVTFTAADTLGHTVPAGTTVLLDLGNAGTVFFTTTADGAIAAGSSASAPVPVIDTAYETLPNGVAAGTALTVVDSIFWLQSAVLATAPTGGVNPETDTDWLNRGAQVLDRLVSTLVLPQHFTSFALGWVGADGEEVYRATTVNNWDPTAGGGAGAVAYGHVTVAVLQQGNSAINPPTPGAALSAGDKTALAAAMLAETRADMTVHVVDPTVTSVDVTATVTRQSGYSDAQVQASVLAALQAWLTTDTWAWGATVRYNQLLTVIAAAPGVAYVNNLTLGPHGGALAAADLALAGVAPLATLGTLTLATA